MEQTAEIYNRASAHTYISLTRYQLNNLLIQINLSKINQFSKLNQILNPNK